MDSDFKVIMCRQQKCCYNPVHSKDSMEVLNCPDCSECGAPSWVINEGCQSCWNCMKDEGYIRGNSKDTVMAKEALKLLMEVEK